MGIGKAADTIKSSLDSTTSDPGTGVPGLVFVSVGKDGGTLIAHASGKRGLNHPQPMSLDTVFWIASCTKLITGIAAMQLVEQGKLALDDAQQVYKICPELRDVKVIDSSGKLVDRKGDITLRLLLSHMAGFGYTFFNDKLCDYGRPIGLEEFSGDAKDILEMPLVNQPNTVFEYGTNIDWAGLMVERVSGMKLGQYFKERIFDPLGIRDISFFPSEEMKSELACMHQRWKDGSVDERDHVLRRALTAETEEEKSRIFNSGGAGCFAKPVEYCKILSTLLNNGVSPHTNARILSESTVDEMFTNQIPQHPDFARLGLSAAKAEYVTKASELFPQEGDPPQGWGLTFFLRLAAHETGSGANTAHWAGLPNLFWWVDREKGVAGMIAAQIVPFGELEVVGQWLECERAIYEGLGE